MLIWPLRMLGQILAQAQRAVAVEPAVHEVLVAEPEVVDAPHAAKLPKPSRAVRPASCGSRRVTFGYPAGRPGPCSTGSTSAYEPASRSPWSGQPAAARRPSPA